MDWRRQGSDKVIYNIADKLKEIFKREREDHHIDIELETETYRIKVIRIKDRDSNLKDYDFHCFVGKLKKSDLKKEDVINDPFKMVSLELEPLFDFKVEDCRNKESFEKCIKQELSKKDRPIDLTKFGDIDKRLGNLYKGLYSDYSYIRFRSLASGPDVGVHEADKILTVILRDILLAKCKADKKVGRILLDKFLGEEYQFPLFRRLVLLVVSNTWDEYGDLLWKLLEYNPDIFDESDYEVELYKLLQANIYRFTKMEREKIKTLISKGPRYIPDQKQEHYIAYWKQRWYSSMLKDSYFAKLYEEQKVITGIKEIEPPREEIIVTSRVEELSPLSKEKILGMSNPEIAEYLKEFKQKDVWEGPSERGLAEVLRSAVKEKPENKVDPMSRLILCFFKLHLINSSNNCNEGGLGGD